MNNVIKISGGVAVVLLILFGISKSGTTPTVATKPVVTPADIFRTRCWNLGGYVPSNTPPRKCLHRQTYKELATEKVKD